MDIEEIQSNRAVDLLAENKELKTRNANQIVKIEDLEAENKKLQKQNDLLTLGLLQGKNKVAALNKKMVSQAAYIRELETDEPKLCICCEEITEENAHLHRNCGE